MATSGQQAGFCGCEKPREKAHHTRGNRRQRGTPGEGVACSAHLHLLRATYPSCSWNRISTSLHALLLLSHEVCQRLDPTPQLQDHVPIPVAGSVDSVWSHQPHGHLCSVCQSPSPQRHEAMWGSACCPREERAELATSGAIPEGLRGNPGHAV